MKVKLPYGKKSLILDLPDNQVQIIEPKELEETSTTSETLENALEKPLAGSKLKDMVGTKKCVLWSRIVPETSLIGTKSRPVQNG